MLLSQNSHAHPSKEKPTLTTLLLGILISPCANVPLAYAPPEERERGSFSFPFPRSPYVLGVLRQYCEENFCSACLPLSTFCGSSLFICVSSALLHQSRQGLAVSHDPALSTEPSTITWSRCAINIYFVIQMSDLRSLTLVAF